MLFVNAGKTNNSKTLKAVLVRYNKNDNHDEQNDDSKHHMEGG